MPQIVLLLHHLSSFNSEKKTCGILSHKIFFVTYHGSAVAKMIRKRCVVMLNCRSPYLKCQCHFPASYRTSVKRGKNEGILIVSATKCFFASHSMVLQWLK